MREDQARDVYRSASSGASVCGETRMLLLGSPGPSGSSIASRGILGFGFGLLVHDMVEEFILHYFTVSAHAYTRGTFTTPESSDLIDRDLAPVAYSSAGVVTAPTYLKWMLCFEEPESKTLWITKATPRDWIAPGEEPLIAKGLSTRYGRVSISLQVAATEDSYMVHGNLTVPEAFSTATGRPLGGIRLRIRAPLEYAGRMSGVKMGGAAWVGFNAGEETIDIKAEDLTPALIKDGLTNIEVTFS